MEDLKDYARQLGLEARRAARRLAVMQDSVKSEALRQIATSLRAEAEALLEANQRDVATAEAANLAAPLVERLRLTPRRIESMAEGVAQIASQIDPVGQTIQAYNRPNGLRVEKRRCPIGVVLFFYESRPNVTADAAALCIKSGNAVILRGGKEAMHSNTAIATIISRSIAAAGLPAASVQLVQTTDRALVPILLKQRDLIDLVIPRGGKSLIEAVVAESTIPVLKHFDGNCHLYVDQHIDGIEQQVIDVCVNAKTSYPGGAVCNAVEHILFHERAASRLLAKVCDALAARGVQIRADELARTLYPAAVPATSEDWTTEYLALIVGVKVVRSLEEAIQHINTFGSHHTDGILSTDRAACERFANEVDSSSVMINASTRFADGGEYGLGAELGISTDKLHARGPMGAADLTTYKWIVSGQGHVRG
ncbi:MAG: glutamate-5-semialdehyde dehydrogenase [Phycisphaerales bacterium]|nr:glutamate-5-semialdehyde dehydrogenase [Phycisphaerales bacterium]